MDLNLITTFTKVAEFGSFTKAAKNLNQPKSRVSRAIARLEEHLGVQLVRRTTRQTALTTAGREFYQRTHLLMQQLNEEVDQAANASTELAGKLRITAPEDLASTILPSIISNYTLAHPKVVIESVITNDVLNLTKENIDLAFRAGKLKSSNLMQRKIQDVRFVIVATPEYLQRYGKPKVLADLNNHRCLFFRNFGIADYLQGKKVKLEIEPSFRSDSLNMLVSLALEHNGITMVPNFLCKKYLNSGELIQLFGQMDTKKGSIHIVYPPAKKMPAKTRAFIDLSIETMDQILN
jgi:DNA-binding transcriptional LysR family regulator